MRALQMPERYRACGAAFALSLRPLRAPDTADALGIAATITAVSAAEPEVARDPT